MPPKAKVTKEKILEAALNIVRRDGASKLNARSVAKELNCSTQPIFSFYKSMEELKNDLMITANDYNDKYVLDYIQRMDILPYKASGMAYIQFAKDEKELFKFLFMNEKKNTQMWESEHGYIIEMVMASTGLDKAIATKFHLQMWLFVHGIATFSVTSCLEMSEEQIHEFLDCIYFGVLEAYKRNE